MHDLVVSSGMQTSCSGPAQAHNPPLHIIVEAPDDLVTEHWAPRCTQLRQRASSNSVAFNIAFGSFVSNQNQTRKPAAEFKPLTSFPNHIRIGGTQGDWHPASMSRREHCSWLRYRYDRHEDRGYPHCTIYPDEKVKTGKPFAECH
ncbi:hypothetical protein DFH06DRAFT_1474882 [Mycena polygramma]|nr:hypothetical protein DFH06DRAFT_1474882 [Mycena polygramma]